MPIIKETKQKIPFRGLMYGEQGVGKSRWALAAPGVLAIDPTGGLEQYKKRADFELYRITSLSELHEAIGGGYPEFDGAETLVLDEFGAIEQMVWTDLCQKNNWHNIKSPGWGDGYDAAAEVVRNILAALEQTGKNVILTAHATVDKKRDNPLGQDYARFDIALHKHVRQLVWSWSDFQLFMRHPVVVAEVKDPKTGNVKTVGMESGATPIICTTTAPGYAAKNRYHCRTELPRGNEPNKSFAEFGHYIAASRLDMDELRAQVEHHKAFSTQLREDQLTQLYVHTQMEKESNHE